MRIGVLVGKKEDGSFEVIGEPGSIDELDKLQREETAQSNYVKTWLADVSQNPLKAKKCAAATPAKKKAAKTPAKKKA